MQRIQQRKHRVKPHLSWIFPAAQQIFLARLKFGSAMQRCSDAHQYFHYYWQACVERSHAGIVFIARPHNIDIAILSVCLYVCLSHAGIR